MVNLPVRLVRRRHSMFRNTLNSVFRFTTSQVTYVFGKAFSRKYLLTTNMVLSAGLSAAADVSVQHICRSHELNELPEHEREARRKEFSIDKQRVIRMTITGLITGTLGHYWYIFLDSRMTGRSIRQVLKKTFIDQLVFAPVGIGSFFFILGYLEGTPVKETLAEVRAKGPELMLVDWVVYPPAQIINFRFLPTQFRLLYDCVIAFGLDLYYSHMKYER